MKNPESDRQYFIDWLRILLILSVFLFHVGMIFNTWQWHIKNNVQFGGLLTQAMTFLHNWRMPLLFMLSGAGTFFALGKRTPGQYLTERFKRLVIPLVVGIFTLVPVQVYLEKAAMYSSLPDFYSHMFEDIYPFYLLHQPLIIITGYFATRLEIAVVWKVFIVLLTAFTLTVSIYWFLIMPNNFFRIIFGMKKIEKPVTGSVSVPALIPARVKGEIY